MENILSDSNLLGGKAGLQKPKNAGTKVLFKNPLLERLTRTHISVPISLLSLYAAVLLYWSITHTSLSAGVTIGMFILGIFVFTWVEYVTHRYVFHMATYSKFREKMQYMIHGVHHEFPKDKDRLAMPPLLSITIATILLLLFRLMLGDLAFSFLPGFLVGYAFYLSVHYMVHAFQPPRNMFKYMWVNHSIHHYKHGEHVFGVTTPFWDYIYGTMDHRNNHGAIPHHHHHHHHH